MRTLVLLAYLILLTVGTYFIVQREQREPAVPVTFVAARSLNENALLRPGDLEVLPTDRQYLRRAVPEGDRVTEQDLSPVPRLARQADGLTVAWPVAAELVSAGTVNAGESVRICPADLVVPVQAVICLDARSECLALVGIAAEDSTEAAEKLAGSTTAVGATQSCED